MKEDSSKPNQNRNFAFFKKCYCTIELNFSNKIATHSINLKTETKFKIKDRKHTLDLK